MVKSVTPWIPSCNGSIRVKLDGRHTTSDSGALLLREALDSSGTIDALEDNLIDRRDQSRVRHSLASQLRTLILQRAMGWFDLSDTTTLRDDPIWRLACSDARGTTPLAQDRPSQATLSRVLNCLGNDENIDVMHEGLLRMAIWRLTTLRRGERPYQLTLDVDGLPIEVFGEQGGSAWNGHVGARIYSPLIASIAETGDMVGGLLRRGNAGTAEEADTWIPHLVRRLKEGLGADVHVRIDAGFTGNDTLEALEDHGIHYMGRLRSNPRLEERAERWLRPPRGRRPYIPREWCCDLRYQADSWPSPRRVVLVVMERPGDLFLDHFFIVTNHDWRDMPAWQVLAEYRRRGKAESHMGELKSTLNVHLSSTDRGASSVQQVMARNEANLLLSLLSYQVLHGLRCLLESRTARGWSLNKVREQVLKVAATLSIHARRITVHLGDAADKWWPMLLKGPPRFTALI